MQLSTPRPGKAQLLRLVWLPGDVLQGGPQSSQTEAQEANDGSSSRQVYPLH